MKNRRSISIILFVLGVVFCLFMGLIAHNWTTGILGGAVLILGGFIFFRRGR